jgi:hypothetical protein
LGNQQVVELTRIYAPTDSNKRRARSVNYRHVIDSLRRKPRAFSIGGERTCCRTNIIGASGSNS